mgnify:FL=1|tara:strand:- start:13296 stop:14072 length:777 start_codon:yes stop_codon:yes gene_type:complete
MKHLVMRAYSTIKKNFFYGAPGLGDRIHHIMLCYNYSLVENTPVTLHLTKYQWNRHKPDSWPEIMSLFPEGKVFIEKHLDHEPKDNKSFLEFVKNIGYKNAEEQIYDDFPQRFEPKEGIHCSKYLKLFPNLTAKGQQDLSLPSSNFITVQFDSTSKNRMMKQKNRQQILAKYKNYEKIIVGGESTNPLLKNSLAHIAFAMSQAKFHVGVDSGFLHMSQLYFDPEKIHIYTTRDPSKWSHHLRRGYNNGMKINLKEEIL